MTSSRYRETLRDAIILHGRELVNVGTEKDWGSRGASKSDIVKRGAAYIRMAGPDVQSMDLDSLKQDELFAPLVSQS